jgi:hypothetical protein
MKNFCAVKEMVNKEQSHRCLMCENTKRETENIIEAAQDHVISSNLRKILRETQSKC